MNQAGVVSPVKDAPSQLSVPKPPPDHLVHFYDDDDVLTSSVAKFLADGIRRNDSLIVIASEAHAFAVRRHLDLMGFDVTAALTARRLVILDAHVTLSKLMRGGEPDRDAFESVVGSVVAHVGAHLAPSAALRAYGEMIDILWQRGERKAAIRLEELWNDLRQRHSFTLLCAYAMGSFYRQSLDLADVCATHSRVHAADGTTAASADDSSLLLPQYTRRLEKEIAQREEVERALRESLGELRAQEEQLRSSQHQLQLVTDALPVLVALIDADQRYRFVSATYEKWFGHAKAELLGRHMKDVLGADAYRSLHPYVQRAIAGETVTYEAEMPYRDGGSRFIEATYVPQRDVAGRIIGFVALVADVSERRSFERFRHAAAARAEKLLKITGAIAGAVAAEQVYEAVVDQVADAVDASSCALWFVDESGRNAHLMRSRGYADAARRALTTLALDVSPTIPVIDCMRRSEALWIPSQAALLAQYPHLTSVATPGRQYRVACLPLMANGRTLGALAITVEGVGEDATEAREFLRLVSSYASQAIERLRLFDAERRSRADADAAVHRLGVLSQASRAFVDSNLDLEPRLHGVVTELASALDSCVNIGLIRADGLLHLTAAQHPDPEAQALLLELSPSAPLRVGEGITGAIAATGESTLVPAIDHELMASRAPAPYRAFLRRYPAYAMIGAPLKVRGRVIGTVTATRCRPGETYGNDDLRLLQELAERAAVAIENCRLYEETVAARTRAEQLYRFAQAVVAADRVETVYDAALHSIEAALGAERSAILTFGNEGTMRFRAWRRLSTEYRNAVDGHSPWSRDSLSPEPVLVKDAQNDPAWAAYVPVFEREGIGALAFIPLVTGGRLIGKFMVYYDRPHEFVSSEIETARSIANHLASVIARFAAIARLEDSIRYTELFAGVLAHDLRNPLGAMITGAQLLLMRREGEKALGDGETKPLARILSSGQRMTIMIEQLLDFTRARSGGGLAIEPHDASLADLLGQALGEIELAHPEWTIQREVLGDPRGHWDSDRLLQVLSNLISNAGQHGTPGAPVRITLDGTLRDTVRIEIQNLGQIPEALLPYLFDPFRGTTPRRQSRGLGLGLYIVREIVRGHGGTIEVTSSEPRGTSFMVHLPRKATPKTAASIDSTGLWSSDL